MIVSLACFIYGDGEMGSKQGVWRRGAARNNQSGSGFLRNSPTGRDSLDYRVAKALRHIEEYLASVKNPESKALLEKLLSYRVAQGLSPRTNEYVIRYLSLLANEISKPLSQASLDEIHFFLSKVREERGSGALFQAVKAIKIFLGFIGREREVKQIRWPRDKPQLPNVLTVDEVKAMIKATRSLKWKALIAVLYEGGCRAGEITSLRIRDVTFDQHGARIIVRGKTGMRSIRLIASAPILHQWIENHPEKNNPDALVFPNEYGDPLSNEGLNRIIRRIAKDARIKKRVHAHLFRHSRATHLAKMLTD
ncbi:MAG: tyrosine-type recombinase/integrase, partial [Candidatus Nezhaarchaeales archaeon]